jgi:protoporphyrinogen/coproporphyrinogen III oxidase
VSGVDAASSSEPAGAGSPVGAAREPDVDVVVAGGGVAGLVIARQLARLGHSVLVVEERDTPGGLVAARTIAGVEVDAGAESFATRQGTVAALIDELGLGDDIVSPNPAGAWVTWNGGAAPLPASGLLGIPGVPLADDVRRVIGWRGSLRAYLDRLMPLLRVRPETDLGDIVRRRMGRTVLDRLVTPVVAGVHSADPSVVDVHAVAPGLTQAMTTQGSLSGAVMALREMAPAGSQVQGLRGGMHRLVQALEADCRYYGVEFRTGTRVTGVTALTPLDAAPATGADVAADAGTDATGPSSAPGGAHPELGDPAVAPVRWTVRLEGATATDDPDGADAPPSVDLSTRALVVATGFRTGLELLAAAGGGRGARGATAALPGAGAGPEPASVTIATLVLDAPALDAHPRGTGVLVAAGTPGVRAKALTHSSAKWAWLAELLPAHRHVVRLSYGRRDATAGARVGAGAGTGAGVGAGGEIEVDRETALQDASALLGVRLDDSTVAGFGTTPWHDSLAFATVGHKARVRQALAAVQEMPGLDVVGAWVSGTGLAATVAFARATASGLAAELRGERRLDR